MLLGEIREDLCEGRNYLLASATGGLRVMQRTFFLTLVFVMADEYAVTTSEARRERCSTVVSRGHLKTRSTAPKQSSSVSALKRGAASGQRRHKECAADCRVGDSVEAF